MLTVITVNNQGDFTDTNPNITTLREAINAANFSDDPDQIVFDETVFDSNVANRIINIQLGNLVINERVTITGPSTGFVFINDASATADTGLTFSGFDLSPTGIVGDTSVSGLVIDGFENGIKLQNLTSSGFNFTRPFRVEGNFIQNVSNNGILLDNADIPFEIHDNTILGVGTGTGVGIFINNSGQFLPNGNPIVNFQTPVSNIGNFDTGTGNGIAGFGTGIFFQASFFPDLRISDNQIGDQTKPNASFGIIQQLFHGSAPLTTGIGQIDNNAIIFNGDDGIRTIFLDGTIIEDNYIAANGSAGIELAQGADDYTIRRNTFDSNLEDAIVLDGSAGIGNRITENNYFGVNVGAGHQAIDLGADGPTANDFDDPDGGPNSRQNYPEIIDAEISEANGIWTIPIEFDATAGGSGDYRLEFYRFNVPTGSFKFIRAVTETVPGNAVGTPDIDKSYDFENGTELSDGDRIGVVAIYELGANANNTSELSLSSLSAVLPDSGAPNITDVRIDRRGGNPDDWAASAEISFATRVAAGKQFKPIATQGANTIDIVFSENVSFGNNGNELELKQKNGAVIGFSSFAYDPFTFTAKWTFTAELPHDKLAIHLSDLTITDASGNRLDGDWENDDNDDQGNSANINTPDDITDDTGEAFSVGDGIAGSLNNEFRFHFAYLPGDYDGNGVVEHGSEAATGDGNGDGVVDASDLNLGVDGEMLSLRGIGGADFGSTTLGIVEDEIVNGFDLKVWESGFGTGGSGIPGDANGDGLVNGADFLFWQSEFGSFSAWYEGNWSPGTGGTLAQILVGLAPQITELVISGSNSLHAPFAFSTVDGSGSQIATVPVGGADTISITFSELVNVDASSLTLIGLQTANKPQLAEFSYDSLTMTATWRFEGWSLGDQYLISVRDTVTDLEGNLLDGEWVNPQSISTTNSLVSTFPSGDGTAGGHFNFVATLLAGDANLDGIVNGNDFGILLSNWGVSVGALFQDADSNGDGAVNSLDFSLFSNNWLTNLQVVSVMADVNGDFLVDATDTATINANFGMTGASYADGDLNSDGVVDIKDLDLAFAQFGLGLDLVA